MAACAAGGRVITVHVFKGVSTRSLSVNHKDSEQKISSSSHVSSIIELSKSGCAVSHGTIVRFLFRFVIYVVITCWD